MCTQNMERKQQKKKWDKNYHTKSQLKYLKDFFLKGKYLTTYRV